MIVPNPKSIRQRVLAAVLKLGSATARSVANETGVAPVTVCNVLSNLGSAGDLVRVRETGRRACQWRVATAAEKDAAQAVLQLRQRERVEVAEKAQADALRDRQRGVRLIALTDTRHNEPGISPGYRPTRWSPSY